jgi:hypothetical protein
MVDDPTKSQNLINDSDDDSLDDEELLDTQRDVLSTGDNELVVAEKAAIEDDGYDLPLEAKLDPGTVDEANMPAELWEEGTHTDVEKEDLDDDKGEGGIGMHIVELASSDDDNDSIENFDNQQME